jgi:hypothetical protein
MSPDARELLRNAAAEPALPLDIERAWRRGRRLRWGRRAIAIGAAGAVAVAAWTVAANDGALSEGLGRDTKPAGRNGADVGEQKQARRVVQMGAGRAATLAIRGALEQGLMDSEGEYWDYEGVQLVGDRWVARFRSTCTQWSTECTRRAAPLTVEVVRFAGAPPTYSIDPPGEDAGAAFPVPDDLALDGGSALFYRGTEVIDWGGNKLLWATPIWTGPIPARGLKDRCQAVLNRADGATVFVRRGEGLADAARPPQREDERSGQPFVLEVGDSITSGAIGC